MKLQFILFTFILVSSQLWSEGKLSNIKIIEYGLAYDVIELTIEPRSEKERASYIQTIIKEDIFKDTSVKQRELVVVLDRISHDFRNFDFYEKSKLLKGFSVKSIHGSRRLKNVKVDKNGLKPKTTLLTFKGKENLNLSQVTLNKTASGLMSIRFKISTLRSLDASIVKNNGGFSKYVTLTRDKFADPLPDLVTEDSFTSTRNMILEKIKQTGEGKYVTSVHQLVNIPALEAEKLVRPLLSPDGEMQVSIGNDLLILTDRKEYVLNILQILHKVDRQEPEVQIEVKVIELSKGGQKQLGLDWSGKASKSKRSILGELNTVGGAAANPLSKISPSSALEALARDDLDSLTVKLSAMIQDGKAKVMAEPKLLVANNTKGEFKMTERHPFMVRKSINLSEKSSDRRTKVDSLDNTTNQKKLDLANDVTYPTPTNDGRQATNYTRKGENTTTQNTLNRDSITDIISDDVTRGYKFEEVMIESGIKLSVTPHILKSGVIELDLNPIITEISGQASNTDTPIVSIREIKTRAYVKDGDTLVLGGLMYEKSLDSENRIPVLSKIPMVGRLFKNKSKTRLKTELLFLVRTRIVQL